MAKKTGKKAKKSEFKDFFDKHPETLDGGWHTSTAAMMMDDAEGAVAAEEHEMGEAQQPQAAKQQGNEDMMDTGEGSKPGKRKPAGATTHVPGLGVVTHSMKRGDRTTNQKKRKAAKLAKAMARSEKVTTKVDLKQQKKSSKLSLKHLYD